MRIYGKAKNSRLNLHDANLCDCEACNVKDRKVVKKKARQEGKRISRINNFDFINGQVINLSEMELNF